jgi:hypothetical protein
MKIRNKHVRRTIFIISLPFMIPFIFIFTIVDMTRESYREFIHFCKSMWFGQDNEFED